MDWEKVGQAFQGGANVLAGGLMDKYQRKRDLEDWEQKQRLATTIQMDEEERRWGQADKVRREQAFRDSLKNDMETNPELQPFVERHLQGDPEAGRVLSLYAGSKYKMYQDTPLSSEEIAALSPLPPGIRHTIIRSHLTVLRKRADEELTRTSKEKENELRDARIAELTDRAERADTEKGAAEINKTQAETTKLVTDRMEARDKKLAAIQQLDTNILRLEELIGDKERNLATEKVKTAKPGIQKGIDGYRAQQGQLNQQKERLEADLQREADVLKKRRPDLFPEEVSKPPAEEMSREVLEFLATLPDEDKLEIQKAIKARPELSQEAIIRAYAKFKQQANPVAPPPGRRW